MPRSYITLPVGPLIEVLSNYMLSTEVPRHKRICIHLLDTIATNSEEGSERKECKHCGGSGLVDSDHYAVDVSDYLPDIPCPECGGETDNGFDRCLPPNPYSCSKCEEKEK